jgi:hypothetical protein
VIRKTLVTVDKPNVTLAPRTNPWQNVPTRFTSIFSPAAQCWWKSGLNRQIYVSVLTSSIWEGAQCPITCISFSSEWGLSVLLHYIHLNLLYLQKQTSYSLYLLKCNYRFKRLSKIYFDWTAHLWSDILFQNLYDYCSIHKLFIYLCKQLFFFCFLNM